MRRRLHPIRSICDLVTRVLYGPDEADRDAESADSPLPPVGVESGLPLRSDALGQGADDASVATCDGTDVTICDDATPVEDVAAPPLDAPLEADGTVEQAAGPRVHAAPAPRPARWALAANRDDIVRCFQDSLDEMLAREEPPEGVDAEILARFGHGLGSQAEQAADDGTDLYSLWSAVVALSQETKLQGRAFRDLAEALGSVDSLNESVRAMLATHEEARSDHRQALETARRIADDAHRQRIEQDRRELQRSREEARVGILDLLLDVRDRLVRGLRSARVHLAEVRKPVQTTRLMRLMRVRPPDNGRLIGAAGALVKGYALSLARLDEALSQFGVVESDCVGRPFDPGCMMAVDVEEAPSAADGTVLEVYRPGYQRHGSVYRIAEVKVARGVSPVRPGEEHADSGSSEEQR